MDPETFRELSARHLQALLRFARTLCESPADAEDLVQETYARALDRAPELRDEHALRAWLLRVTYTTFVDLHRQTRARSHVVPVRSDEEMRSILRRAGRPSGQEAHLEARELMEAVAALPEHQRVPLWLTGVEGCSYAEAARICDCAVGTIRSRVARARAEVALRVAGPDTGDEDVEGA